MQVRLLDLEPAARPPRPAPRGAARPPHHLTVELRHGYDGWRLLLGASFVEPFERKEPQRVEHAGTARSDCGGREPHEQRVVEQRCDVRMRAVAAHRLGRLQRERRGEHAEPREHPACPAAADRGSMPPCRGGCAAAAAAGGGRRNAAGPGYGQPSRRARAPAADWRQLDGQRQPSTCGRSRRPPRRLLARPSDHRARSVNSVTASPCGSGATGSTARRRRRAVGGSSPAPCVRTDLEDRSRARGHRRRGARSCRASAGTADGARGRSRAATSSDTCRISMSSVVATMSGTRSPARTAARSTSHTPPRYRSADVGTASRRTRLPDATGAGERDQAVLVSSSAIGELVRPTDERGQRHRQVAGAVASRGPAGRAGVVGRIAASSSRSSRGGLDA